jgi:GT2 family glycosyltransferase
VSRPPVSVVMPFAGSSAAARDALDVLAGLRAGPDDELILVDNRGIVPTSIPEDGGAVQVVRASAEHSPAYARNAGAERAACDWILFLDADCQALPDLLDRYFDAEIAPGVGALAGGVGPAAGSDGVAAGYGAAKSFLNQDAHLSHPFMPRAVAANLLVRRAAFEQIGGFFEGVRAAEDTDFSWRLQRAGWGLEGRPQAAVTHRYRTTVRALRRQWRGYAAGRAWLARRYEDFEPQPALARAAGRVLHRHSPAAPARPGADAAPAADGRRGRGGRAAHLALDALLGVDELAGFALSNRPRQAGADEAPAQVVLVADRFPRPGDPLTDYVLTLADARVEAAARPEVVDRIAARRLAIDYREDDGVVARAVAVVRLLIRHPLRSGFDLWRRPGGAIGLAAIAPATLRLRHDTGARVHALGGEDARAVAARLAALSGHPLD